MLKFQKAEGISRYKKNSSLLELEENSCCKEANESLIQRSVNRSRETKLMLSTKCEL